MMHPSCIGRRLSEESLIMHMKYPNVPTIAALTTLLLSSCASPKISSRPVAASETGAVALVSASQQAHGGNAFRKVKEITVAYEGKWGAIGPRFQPVLVDRQFRGNSKEHWDAGMRTLKQIHTGAAGQKVVVRQPGKVNVSYNGTTSTDAEKNQAAALVADAYSMFLLGPHYFDRKGVTLVSHGSSKVDEYLCDEVLAVLRPGFGMAEEDRVVLFIDRASKQLRRVGMTLNGLESTRGAEVDVTFRNFRSVEGVLWATDFDERIRVPFDLHAHHWTLQEINVR